MHGQQNIKTPWIFTFAFTRKYDVTIFKNKSLQISSLDTPIVIKRVRESSVFLWPLKSPRELLVQPLRRVNM